MRQLGEQWVENGRMYKAVLQESKIINRVIDGNICHGCCHVDNWDDDCLHTSRLCPLDKGLIVKDLGPVNEDGCLPSPWGGYPKIIHEVNQTRIENGEDVHYDNLWCVEIHEPVLVCTDEYLTEQEAIDAWNWRS